MAEKVTPSNPGGGAVHRDWTRGGISGNLLSLCWPIVIANGLNLLGPTVDMIWVGKLGSASVAGVGVAGMIVMVVLPFMMGINMGSTALVARFVGAGDEPGASRVVNQAFVVSASLGFSLALVGIFLAEPILRLFGVAPDVAAEGGAYLRISLVGTMMMAFVGMTSSAMQASGDTMSPMRVAVAARLFHVAMAPFFIFGWWLFPRLGVSGAALTNIISQGLGAGLGMWFLLSGRTRLRVSFNGFRLDPGLIRRIVRIGLPAAGNFTLGSVLGVVVVRFMIPFGTAAVAAHTIVQRVDMLMMLPGMAIGQAAGVLVGQNLGARQPQRAEETAWRGAGLVAAITAVLALVIVLLAERIVGVFNTEAGVVATGSTFLRIAAAGYVFVAFSMVLWQSLMGAGDTAAPTLISLVQMWMVQIPLAFFLPRVTSLGVYGIRWGMVAGIVTGTTLCIVYFRLGRWKHKRV